MILPIKVMARKFTKTVEWDKVPESCSKCGSGFKEDIELAGK